MSRKGPARKRELLPDPVYHDRVVTQFINCMQQAGKKSIAESVFYGAVETVEGRLHESGLDMFRRALDNVKPAVEVRSRRVGGATYQVPVEVRSTRQMALAIRWRKGRCGRAMKSLHFFQRAGNVPFHLEDAPVHGPKGLSLGIGRPGPLTGACATGASQRPHHRG